VIELRDVHVRLASPVLRGVDWGLARGEIVALIGAPASGKSVLLKSIVGLLPTASGSVRVGDQDVGSASLVEMTALRRRVGMLFQNVALFEHLTVADNIAFPLRRLFSLPEQEVTERVAERLERVALSGFETRFPTGLSGGQRRRVGVARATVARPEIVLYDEPAAGLDPVTTQKIFTLIRDEQRAQNTAVVMVSSDVKNVLRVVDRVTVLHEGRVAFDGPTSEALSTRDALVRQLVDGRGDGPL
jgi:phospholipid/cholesterol/gamma-HCH transport system ATP-binding protein